MILLDPNAVEELREFDLAKTVGEALQEIYPGHLWAVACEGGVVKVTNMALSGVWGFVMHANKIEGDQLRAKLTLFGGELLERYNVSRNKKQGQQEAMIRLKSRMDRPSIGREIQT